MGGTPSNDLTSQHPSCDRFRPAASSLPPGVRVFTCSIAEPFCGLSKGWRVGLGLVEHDLPFALRFIAEEEEPWCYS